MKSFHCLMVNGGNLNNGVRDALYLTASKMLRRRKGALKFKDECATGIVRTTGKRHSISSVVCGVEFQATIDCANGTSLKCGFLVDDRHLIPDESFYEGEVSWPKISFEETDDDEGESWKNA